MRHVSLFSGIGGIDLAAEWAGFTTVLFVEIDPYCQAVLRKHWPGVPVIGDIRDVNEATVADATGTRWATRASEGQLGRRGENSSNGTATFPSIDLLTGGFPCQPFSVAGKRGGSNDDRFLWPEMLRVIALLRPRWVLAENVAGIINMALDDVLSDLEGQGYETGTVVLPACAVNAPHRRDRVFIVAHTARGEDDGRERGIVAAAERCGQGIDASAFAGREDVADTGESSNGRGSRPRWRNGEHQEAQNASGRGRRPQDGIGSPESRLGGETDEFPGRLDGCWDGDWEGDTPRVAQGVPNRVNRLRCLGNAVVPAQAYPILQAVVAIELATVQREATV